MGSKIHPLGNACELSVTGIQWYAEKDFAEFYMKIKIRDYIRKQLNEASVSTIEIERLIVLMFQSTQPNQVW